MNVINHSGRRKSTQVTCIHLVPHVHLHNALEGQHQDTHKYQTQMQVTNLKHKRYNFMLTLMSNCMRQFK